MVFRQPVGPAAGSSETAMKKRILTTGGIGFLGGHLVSRARTRFHPVATYYQNPSFGEGAEWVYLDLTGPAPLEDLVRKVQSQKILFLPLRNENDAFLLEGLHTVHVNVK